MKYTLSLLAFLCAMLSLSAETNISPDSFILDLKTGRQLPVGSVSEEALSPRVIKQTNDDEVIIDWWCDYATLTLDTISPGAYFWTVPGLWEGCAQNYAPAQEYFLEFRYGSAIMPYVKVEVLESEFVDHNYFLTASRGEPLERELNLEPWEIVPYDGFNFNSPIYVSGSFNDLYLLLEAFDYNYNEHIVRAFTHTKVRVYIDASGVENCISTDNGPAEYYNLHGQVIESPARGTLVLRKQGNKVEKVIL